MDENADIWDLWHMVSTQWRPGGMGGLIGLDYDAVFETADRFGFSLSRPEFGKLRMLERMMIADVEARMEKDRNKG